MTVLAIVMAALAAYPLARLNLPGKRLIMSVLIFTQMVPAIVYVIPILLVAQRIGLKDTYRASSWSTSPSGCPSSSGCCVASSRRCRGA